jgi:hypothetical protein
MAVKSVPFFQFYGEQRRDEKLEQVPKAVMVHL